MKYLVVARHGHDNENGLSPVGCEQIMGLAQKLKPLLAGSSVCILSSTAERALKSAEILGNVLGVIFERHEILRSGGSYFEDFPGALSLVKTFTDKIDALILVTHYEYAESFPSYFAEKELGVRLQTWKIKKGEAWLLDCSAKTLIHIS